MSKASQQIFLCVLISAFLSFSVATQPWCGTGSVSDLDLGKRLFDRSSGRSRSPYRTTAEQQSGHFLRLGSGHNDVQSGAQKNIAAIQVFSLDSRI
jgi:hypothetical protein